MCVCLFVCLRTGIPVLSNVHQASTQCSLAERVGVSQHVSVLTGRAVAHAKGVSRRRSDCPRQRTITSKCLRGGGREAAAGR